MLEQRRQQYLSLLGIDSYVPRRLLVSAAAPVLLSHDQIALPPVVDNSVMAKVGGARVSHAPDLSDPIDSSNFSTQKQEKVNPALSPLSVLNALAEPVVSKTVKTALDSVVDKSANSLIDNSIENLVKSSADRAIDSQSNAIHNAVHKAVLSVSASPTKELNFVLSVWRIRDEVLVIDSRQPGAAYPTDKLLQNMLRAIGHPLAQLPASEIIRWPLFVNQKNNSKSIEQKNQDVEQACAMVQAYITAQMTKSPFNALLCMGDSAARFSLNYSPETNAEGNVQGNVSDTLNDSLSDTLTDKENLEKNQWNIPAVITPSLFSMLQEPLLKAKAWSALQKIVTKKDSA